MTTLRTRRNVRDQAGDALRKLLYKQQAETAKRKAAYEEALAAEQPTRKALETLGMEMLPGLESDNGLTALAVTVVPCDHQYISQSNREGPWRCRDCGVETGAPAA